MIVKGTLLLIKITKIVNEKTVSLTNNLISFNPFGEDGK